MHIGFSCIEFFGAGIQGGFGRATRFLGRALARRGVTVSVIVPRRGDLQEGVVDGMRVIGFDPHRPWTAIAAYRACAADIYHSQDTSMGTVYARIAGGGARHVVTFRDPMDKGDWQMETALSGKHPMAYRTYRAFIDNPLVHWAVRRADARYCAAQFLIPKVTKKYGFADPPGFLPTPVDIPECVEKAARPTVAFVGRWDPRKRPEEFFELARRFPQVEFIAVGGSSDPARDAQLRAIGAALPNVRMPGIIDQFSSAALTRILAASWILVNTSAREGLPTAFIEAAAHRCAILSHHDPDGFTSRFGRVAGDGPMDAALQSLLDGDAWRACGARGFEYVRDTFSTERAVDAHLAVYEQLLAGRAS